MIFFEEKVKARVYNIANNLILKIGSVNLLMEIQPTEE